MRHFRKTDLAAILVILGVAIVALVVPALAQSRARAKRIGCICGLKQIGTGFRLWANDHANAYPQTISTSLGGMRELVLRGETFRGFQAASNELTSTKTLICPSDSRKPAKDFDELSNRNLSYFIGLDVTESNPTMLLAGDRNIRTEPPGTNNVLVLTADRQIRITQELHNGKINVGLADGSVQQLSSEAFAALARSGGYTNTISVP